MLAGFDAIRIARLEHELMSQRVTRVHNDKLDQRRDRPEQPIQLTLQLCRSLSVIATLLRKLKQRNPTLPAFAD
jgi:hypothetical protein